MVDELNRFLARTTVDSSVRIAFNEGRIHQILEECGFPREEAAQLSRLPADGFQGFLQEIYAQVVNGDRSSEVDPWPTEGLETGRQSRKRGVA